MIDLEGAMGLSFAGPQTVTLFGITDIAAHAIGTYGRGGVAPLIGTSRGDVLSGGPEDDNLSGLRGDDRLFGRAGNDWLTGQDGDDALFGGAGDDVLVDGPGDDHVFGGAGADRLYGEAGDDELYGAAGADRLFGRAGDDRLFGGDGDDVLSAETGTDRLVGGGGADLFLFGYGFGIREEPTYPPTFVVMADFIQGVDRIGIDPYDHNEIRPYQFDNNNDGSIDTLDRGVALVTREVAGIAETGLLFDLAAVGGFGPIQRTEVFLPNLERLAAAELDFYLG